MNVVVFDDSLTYDFFSFCLRVHLKKQISDEDKEAMRIKRAQAADERSKTFKQVTKCFAKYMMCCCVPQ